VPHHLWLRHLGQRRRLLGDRARRQQVRERWDGRDRWKLYRWERAARAATAQVDPDRVLLIDVNFTNNSSAIEPDRARAARKWTAIWVAWLQDALLTWASLV